MMAGWSGRRRQEIENEGRSSMMMELCVVCLIWRRFVCEVNRFVSGGRWVLGRIGDRADGRTDGRTRAWIIASYRRRTHIFQQFK